MVDVISKKCNSPGCTKHPSFGVEGTRNREYCAKHAPEGMIILGKAGRPKQIPSDRKRRASTGVAGAPDGTARCGARVFLVLVYFVSRAISSMSPLSGVICLVLFFFALSRPGQITGYVRTEVLACFRADLPGEGLFQDSGVAFIVLLFLRACVFFGVYVLCVLSCQDPGVAQRLTLSP